MGSSDGCLDRHVLVRRDGGKEVWEVPVGDSHKILVEWGAEFDNFDPVTQVGAQNKLGQRMYYLSLPYSSIAR